MTGSMYAAIAGLRTHMQNLNVIGHNVANVNTQGYKSSRSIFQTAIYSTLSGGSDGTPVVGGKNPSQIGYGANMASVDIDMSTGNYGVTGKPTDLYLDGDGFFMVGDKTLAANFDGTYEDVNRLTAMTLTRVGNFEFKADGYLSTNDGNVVYGFLCTGLASEADVAAAGPDSGMKVGDPIFSDQLVPIRWPRVAVDENGAVSIAYPGIDETTGHLTDATGENGEELSLATFTSITFDENTGLITGISDDTKETVTIGCIAIGRVTNPNGVTAMGNSYYKAGAGSGDLMINVLGGNAQQMGIHYVNGSLVNDGNNLGAGGDGLVDGLRIRTGGEAKLKASGLEQSKADLAQEIANMIVTQRGYQANTRIITVTDSMLEELVNMKR